MKTITYFLPLLAIPVMMIFMANKSGSQGAFSGSPGDNGINCTSCHAGTSINASGWITTNIPANGYNPGAVYEITLTASDAAAARFGFELTAEDALNKKIAGFNLTNAAETKLTNSSKSVTHTAAGTDPSGNGKTWSFEWTAPAADAGPITFYAAVNAANGNSSTSGDVIYTTSTSVSPAATGIRNLSGSFGFFPNPSTGLVNFEMNTSNADAELVILNSKGQEVMNSRISKGSSQIDLSHLPKGMYFVKFTGKGSSELQKLILQ